MGVKFGGTEEGVAAHGIAGGLLVGGLGHDDGRALDGERVLVSLGRLSPLILIGAAFLFSSSVSDVNAKR